MCTRFVYRGDEVITGFNFDIDLDVWDHKIIKEKDCFYIGILRPDGIRHSYHGVNRNGNVGTLLYVHGNPEGSCQDGKGCTTIADLTEQFVQAKITNYSILAPESTRSFLVPGDDRYERAAQLLNTFGKQFTVTDAFSVLQAVRQEGMWATRVSFVYSATERAVYYVRNNDFSQIKRHAFSQP